jgi:hypothetical protein
MPRYFFYVSNNGSVVQDHLGHELPDDRAATREAASFAEFIPIGAKITVKDDVGRVVCEITSAKNSNGVEGKADLGPERTGSTSIGQTD